MLIEETDKYRTRVFAFQSEHQRARFIADVTALHPETKYSTALGTHSVLNENGDPVEVQTFTVLVQREATP